MPSSTSTSTMGKTDKKELRNVIMGTEIRNVKREICYKTEFGEGVLEHKEVQPDIHFQLTRQVQTEETFSSVNQHQIDELQYMKE